MATTADSDMEVGRPGRRPLWLSILAVYSGLLGLSGLLDPHAGLADTVTTVVSGILYLVYPLWLVPTLLLRRSIFVGGRDTKPATEVRSAS